MLYSKQELEKADQQTKKIANQRYLNKVVKNEVKKLMPHEFELITIMLPSIFTEESLEQPAFDIYTIGYCEEPLFKILILRYLENLDFLRPVFNGRRNLEDDEILRDQKKFEILLEKWLHKLERSPGDPYIHEVKLEYRRKIKLLTDRFCNGLFGGRRLHDREILKQQLSAFYIYYVVKSFFKSHKADFVLFETLGVVFSVNIYSYVHIISRHYIPYLNGIDPLRSFNSNLLAIDPFNLPYSIRDMVMDYFLHVPQDYTLNPEFMIFSQDDEFYILWWKNKKLNELAYQSGYEIRTLYKIEAERDWAKINHENFFQLNEKIRYYY